MDKIVRNIEGLELIIEKPNADDESISLTKMIRASMIWKTIQYIERKK